LEEYKGKIQKWDEHTSTSPGSNMHLGHLKAYWARHNFAKDSDEEAELESIRENILRGHLILLNYALQFGYSFDYWKMVVNAMLEKDPGTPKIHRLRVIHLYEADYNLILAVKWRQLMHFACDKGFVNRNQFGSGHEAMDLAFLLELEYEITRLTRKTILHFDNDATACYDRINVCIGNAIGRKYGMAKNICIVQGRTLAEARYHLKTKLGISEEWVQHCKLRPMFGNGQGAGDSAFKWLFMSSTLFDLYEDGAKGSVFESPDGSWSIEVKIAGFVDDVRNSTNDFGNNNVTLEELTAQASKESQLWHDIMWVCNQKLELNKCGYHALVYEFLTSGEPKIVNNPESTLLVYDHVGQPLQIQQWPANKAKQYLGTKKSISNHAPQLETLTAKCNEFA
jgi:hypothetical protein